MPIAIPDKDRGRRRPRKGPPTPRPRPVKGPPTPHRRVGVFARPPVPRRTPIQRQVVRSRRKTVRAQGRLPPRPVPHVPIIQHPTPRQTQAAKKAITVGLTRAVGPSGSGRQRLERRRDLEQELRSTRQGRELLRAAKHYSRWDERHTAAAVGTAYGARGTRQQRARVGRQVLAGRRARDTVAPGPKRALGGAPHRMLATALTPFTVGQGADAVGLVGRVGGRTVADAVGLPKNAVQGMYQIGAAGVEALQGDTKRAERLIRGLDDGALGQLVQGNLSESAKQFSEHPLYSLLEFTGAGQVAGRSAGAGMRAGLVGRAAKARASTKRAPLQIAPGQFIERSYSPNQIVKEAQLVGEAQARREGRDPNVATGNPRSGLTGRGRHMNSAVDEFVAQAEGMRQRGRAEIARTASKIAPVRRGDPQGSRAQRAAASVDRARGRVPERAGAQRVARGRVERDVVLAAVEGRLRGPKTFKRDLMSERDRLQRVWREERKTMSAETRRANREQVKALDRVLSDPKALANAGEVFRASRDYKAHAGKLERQLEHELDLDPEQALASKLRPYAVARMGARYEKGKPQGGRFATGLVDATGDRITTRQIIAHMKADPDIGGGVGKVDLPGFVSHRRDTSGANSYFVNWFGGRKSATSKGKRTGEATRTGGHAADFRTLEEHLVRTRGVVDAIKTFDDFAGQFAVRGPGKKPYTWDQAERVAGEMEEATGVAMTPIRLTRANFDEKTRAEIMERQASGALPEDMSKITVARLDAATTPPKNRQTANVGLVPTAQLKRFREHQTHGSGVGWKVGQSLTNLFRKTVLPLSVKWMTGNTVESVLRSAFYGITPHDIFRGQKIMREVERQSLERFREVDTRIRGGLLYGGVDKLAVRRASENFEGTAVYTPARMIETAGQVPVIRQMVGAIDVLQRGVFGFNKGVAKAFETGVIGKAARKEAQELGHGWIKALRMQKAVVKEVAAGLSGTSKQVRFARQIDEILGKYTRFSPGTRRLTQAYAPFLPWFLNAARFSLYTLPVHHPAKTALLANVQQTFEKEIKEQQQYAFGEDVTSLDSGIRMPDGGIIDFARYTPFGAFTQGTAALADPWLPQISSIAKIWGGQSWTGRKLRFHDNVRVKESDKVWLSLYAAAESMIPGLQLGRRLREKGETAFDDSTVFRPRTKAGTAYGSSAARRVFDPFRPTYLGGGPSGGGGKAPSAASSFDDADLRDIREAVGGSAGLDEADLEELRRAVAAP